jgi:hypothetical protein
MRGTRTSHVRALPLIMYGTAWKEDRTQALVLETVATPFAALHANAGKPRKSLTSDRMQWYETTMPLQGLPPVFATQLLPGSPAGREQLPCQQSALHSARSTC